ncbi:MAG TPA: MarR family winged helix-turn-helix transcriptional regulator [Stellaceae bacterium]|jgi:DNA-binding MarR family transcriptional regulator|nr:MarR family winged helix-turn-helix transcriptional regulator [Stellaceae bacterium]
MSSSDELSWEATRHIRETCLCVRVQRAARAIARHFDDALRPVGLTHGQYSLLAALNQDEPPIMSETAAALAMDRTTLTANLKPLERDGIVRIMVDRQDKRSRRLVITAKGRAKLKVAFPIWKAAHAVIDNAVGVTRIDRLRADLRAISQMENPATAQAAAE